MLEQVRVGVVGTSWWPDLFYLPVLKSHAQVNLSAVCGRGQARAEEMAAKYGIPQVYTDYEEMFRKGNLDAVVIAVPDDLHYPIAMAALEAGLHVLGEKPMAFNLDQSRRLLAEAEAAGVRHMIQFTWRWAPYFRTLQSLISQGYIGRCLDAQFAYFSDYALGGEYQWKWDRQHGLGILGDLGAHLIDLARLTVGEIAVVQAALSVRVTKAHPDGKAYQPANDSATLSVRFSNGAVGTIFTSAAVKTGSRGQVQRAVLCGEDGTLEVDSDSLGYSLRGIHAKETEFHEIPIPEEFLQGTQRNAPVFDQYTGIFSTQSVGPRLFIDSILADRPVTPGFYEGMKTQAVIDAAFESDRSGCWVDVG